TSNQANSGNRLPAYFSNQAFRTDDLNLRLRWRPWSSLSMMTRYDYQTSRMRSRADDVGSLQQTDLEAHILSETITWQPFNRWYLQGGFSYTYDINEHPSTSILIAGEPLIAASRNNYWNAQGSIGWAATSSLDLHGSYYYYRADNATNHASIALPYGVNAQEHVFRVGAEYRWKPQVLWKASYSFMRSDDWTSGGNNSFDAHGIYTSIQYLF
ncbi:MAG: hypothetical protein MI810_14765, partial [Flavobacteriales bacterium]|nr:hypothetical protein [Flavobacteriales bacterium]